MAIGRTYRVRADVIARLTIQQGLSFDELARRAPIHIRSLRRWMKGGEAFIGNIKNVANVLGVSHVDLIRGVYLKFTEPMALISAISDGDSELAADLIAAGADLTVTNSDGETPLHFASSLGNEGIVAALIAAGADVNARNNDGNTPLHHASSHGHEGIVAALIAAGADVNARNNGGENPLHRASKAGHGAVVTALIAAGAHIVPEQWNESELSNSIKALINDAFARRLAGEVAKAKGRIERVLIGQDGKLTPNGADYACAHALTNIFVPGNWKGRVPEGLELYHKLVNSIPDSLKSKIVTDVDMTPLRRSTASESKAASSVQRYVRRKPNAPKRGS